MKLRPANYDFQEVASEAIKIVSIYYSYVFSTKPRS